MSKYIKVEDAIEAAINGCASWDGGYFPSMDEPIKDEFASIEDKCIELVRCGECKWYEKTNDYGDGYYNCLFHAQEDCAPFPENGYCSYGERKDGEDE